MHLIEKAFSNTRLVFATMFVCVIGAIGAFETAPHGDDPDWRFTMFIVAICIVAIFVLGMIEAQAAAIQRAAFDQPDDEADAKARTREVLANAEREVQRLRDQGWTRSDFGRALADTLGAGALGRDVRAEALHVFTTPYSEVTGHRPLDETSVDDIPQHEQDAYWRAIGETEGEASDEDLSKLYSTWLHAQQQLRAAVTVQSPAFEEPA